MWRLFTWFVDGIRHGLYSWSILQPVPAGFEQVELRVEAVVGRHRVGHLLETDLQVEDGGRLGDAVDRRAVSLVDLRQTRQQLDLVRS